MKVEVITLTESIVNKPYRYYKERTDLVGKNEISITNYISCYNEFYPDSDDVFYLPKQVGDKEVHVITGLFVHRAQDFFEKIHKIYIPNNIIFCHGAWQTDAINLERFEVEEGNQAYCEKDGILYSKDMKILYKCPRHLKDKEGVTVNKVFVPDGVEYIYPQAFDCCAELETIDLPSSLVYIGEEAFCYCRSLKSITIPNSVKYIDGRLYQDGWRHAGIHIQSVGVFAYCKNLQFVDYGMLTILPDGIFAGCESLDSFVGKNVNKVLYAAFRGCDNLKKVVVPNQQNMLPRFGNCGKNLMWYFNKEDEILTIRGHGEMKSYDLSPAPWSIYAIHEVVLSKGLLSIGNSAFSGCRDLTFIEIPDSVTSIGSNAFSDCWNLCSVIIPDSVISIGSHAFSDCKGLESIRLSNNIKNIDNSAFMGCNSLEFIEIPNSVNSIGSSAFYSCSHLRFIEIPNNVTSIEESTFNACLKLNSVEIPNSVTTIKKEAFAWCERLKVIEIPNSVTDLNEGAFSYCKELESITSKAVIPPTLGKDVFKGVDETIPVYVPKESVDAYKNADGWKEFANIQAQ